MKLYYKDYEFPSYQINDNGYLIPWNNDTEKYIKCHSNEVSNYVINAEDNTPYFQEANVLTKINVNEEGYFDFNKAIIDIGAHAGYYSFRSNFKYAYAFEPHKVMYTFLNMNLFMHDKLENSQTYNVLLSNDIEDIKFDGFNTLLTDQDTYIFKHETEESIKPHTLDEYNCTNVGLIKVDVEGMEEKVLRGGIGTIIRNNYPPILFELWEVGFSNMTQEKYDSLKNFLENFGYTIYWNWGDYETHLAIHS